MSYYIATYEIPVELLEKLKALAPDYDLQQDAFYDWKDKIEIPQTDITSVMEAPFRAVSGGKFSMNGPEPDDYEKRFYALLNTTDVDPDAENKPHRKLRPLSEGYPGISDYQDPADIALIWKRIEKIMSLHPEYAVPDLLAVDTFMSIQADHSSVDEMIRFYYGCAMRRSATITIDS